MVGKLVDVTVDKWVESMGFVMVAKSVANSANETVAKWGSDLVASLVLLSESSMVEKLVV